MQAEGAPGRRRAGAGGKARSGGGVARRKRPAGSSGRDEEAPGPGRTNISRQRVVDAAIQCILDQGFYRASSNVIAERAGVSWGVIQYHFGSREALMLAVLEEGTRRLNETVLTAEITGETVTERIGQYMEILASYYGSPHNLAFTEVLINLEHDPRTSEQARATMARISESVSPELNRLLGRVLEGTGIRRPAVRSLLFHALRGLSLSHLMLETVPDRRADSRLFADHRKLLAEALGLLVEAQRKPGR
jgi:AcrR family transcriptional regulator